MPVICRVQFERLTLCPLPPQHQSFVVGCWNHGRNSTLHPACRRQEPLLYPGWPPAANVAPDQPRRKKDGRPRRTLHRPCRKKEAARAEDRARPAAAEEGPCHPRRGSRAVDARRPAEETGDLSRPAVAEGGRPATTGIAPSRPRQKMAGRDRRWTARRA